MVDTVLYPDFWETMEIPKSSHSSLKVHSYIVDHPFPVSICHEFGGGLKTMSRIGQLPDWMDHVELTHRDWVSHPKSGQVTMKNIHHLREILYNFILIFDTSSLRSVSGSEFPNALSPWHSAISHWSSRPFSPSVTVHEPTWGSYPKPRFFLCHVINMVILRNFGCFFLNISESRNTHHWGRGTNDECLGSPWFPHGFPI